MHLPPHSPVLARPNANGRIDMQVGLASPVVLTGLAFDERAFLATLEGGRPITPAQARRFARVVTRLTNARAWAAEPPHRVGGSVAIHGAGSLGMEIATLVHRAGLAVTLHDASPMKAEPVGTYAATASGTCAGAAIASLGARGIPASLAGGGEDAAVVVCTGAPDPLTIANLMRSDVPHVLVVSDEASLWVSHVIAPGVTACSGCRDVANTREDPAWPILSLQLGGCALASRRPTAHGIAAPVAAARVAARLVGWLKQGEPGASERVTADGELVATPLDAEGDCGCGAAGPVGDGVAARRARWLEGAGSRAD